MLEDVRPISIVGSLYNFVAKVLAKKLGSMTDKFMSPNQSGFLKGRMLVDEVVIVIEVIDLSKHARKACLIFKVR